MKTVEGVSLKASEDALISNNSLKIAGCIANSVDPDQIRILQCPMWVYSVCKGLSVPILKLKPVLDHILSDK